MGYATTNGSESVCCYLAGLVKSVVRRLTIGSSLKRFSTATAPAFPGATYRSGLATRRIPIAGLVAGRSAGCGRGCFSS